MGTCRITHPWFGSPQLWNTDLHGTNVSTEATCGQHSPDRIRISRKYYRILGRFLIKNCKGLNACFIRGLTLGGEGWYLLAQLFVKTLLFSCFLPSTCSLATVWFEIQLQNTKKPTKHHPSNCVITKTLKLLNPEAAPCTPYVWKACDLGDSCNQVWLCVSCDPQAIKS